MFTQSKLYNSFEYFSKVFKDVEVEKQPSKIKENFNERSIFIIIQGKINNKV